MGGRSRCEMLLPLQAMINTIYANFSQTPSQGVAKYHIAWKQPPS